MTYLTAAQKLEKAREVTNCPQGVELQEHLKQLVEEILLLNNERLAWAELYADEVGDPDVMEKAKKLPTPATDSILREAEARGVDKAIEHLLTKFSCTGHVGVPAMALEYLAKQLREGKAE